MSFSANVSWVRLVSTILEHGNRVTGQRSAGGKNRQSLELLSHQTIIDMTRPVLTVEARRLGYKFLAAEAWWMLSGDNRVDTIKKYAPEIEQFSDDGVIFYGAYGPQIIPQLKYIEDCLLADENSRQAVISIWRRSPPKSNDIPCTLSSQFVIRNNVLHIFQTMRSSDAWLGWPYDVFNFSMLAAYVCIALRNAKYPKLRLGSLYLTAGSQHLYNDQWDVGLTASTSENQFQYTPLMLSEFDEANDLIEHLEKLKDHQPTKHSFLEGMKLWRSKMR